MLTKKTWAQKLMILKFADESVQIDVTEENEGRYVSLPVVTFQKQRIHFSVQVHVLLELLYHFSLMPYAQRKQILPTN